MGWLVIIVPLRPAPPNRLFGVSRRNAPGVLFSIGDFREFCRAGVICGLSGRLDHTGWIWRGLIGDCGKGFLMKRIVLLIILLFSFSMFSFADNARVDARRDAERDVNDTVWALAGFSAPLLMSGYYMAGGTTGGSISYSVFVPGVVVGA